MREVRLQLGWVLLAERIHSGSGSVLWAGIGSRHRPAPGTALHSNLRDLPSSSLCPIGRSESFSRLAFPCVPQFLHLQREGDGTDVPSTAL